MKTSQNENRICILRCKNKFVFIRGLTEPGSKVVREHSVRVILTTSKEPLLQLAVSS